MKTLSLFVVFALLLSACSALGVKYTTPTPVVQVQPTQDALLSALATNQAQQAEVLEQIQDQLSEEQVTPIPLASDGATMEDSTSETVVTEGQADVGKQVVSSTTDGWNVTTYEGVTNQISSWGKDLKRPVLDWSEFPNVDFPKYSFKAVDGVEYGMAESAYCQQGQTCDVNVPAMHYRLITGDYTITGVDECKKATEKDPGCGIILINVGGVTAMFRDQHVDYGFTVEGRYWNGDAMPVTIWALSSHTLYNMLNEEGNVNMGANCSVPGGCSSVRLTVVIMSGNEILLKGVTTVNR